MSRSYNDLAFGLATLAAATTLISLAAGRSGLLYIGLLIALGLAALRLWQRPSRRSKMLAACLVPALFWSHLMSKGTRQRIKDFEDQTSP